MSEDAGVSGGDGAGASAVGHSAVHDSDRAAGIVSRGAAAVVDVAVVGAMLGACYLGVLLFQLAINFRPGWSWLSAILTTTAFFGLSTAYLFACWAISGRTAGCAVMGLRVVSRNGKHPRPIQALLRSVVCVVFAFGLAWCAVDSKRRSVADILARTRVVYSR